MHRGPVAHGFVLTRRHREYCVKSGCRGVQTGRDEPLAARNIAFRETSERERASLAGAAAVRRAILRMEAAHASDESGGRDRDFVPDVHFASEYRSSDHRADAVERERAIDGQAKAGALP